MEYSKLMVLSSFFLDVAVIRHNRRIFCHQWVFPEDQNKHIRTASLLFCQHNCISFQISLIVNDLKQSWSLSCTFLIESFVDLLYNKTLIYYVGYETMLFLKFCLLAVRSSRFFVNSMRFFFYSKLQVELSQHFCSWRRKGKPDLG